MTDHPSAKIVTPRPDQEIHISKLDPPDDAYLNEFDWIWEKQFKVKVTNLSGHEIGCSRALQWKWKPQTEFRETLRGTLKNYEVSWDDAEELYTGSNNKTYMEQEYDWCLYIERAASFRDKFPDDVVPGKVTPPRNFRDNDWFPLAGILTVDFSEPEPRKFGGGILDGIPWSPSSQLLGFDMCIYGPYVLVEGYDNPGREIHPIDAIWWRQRPPGDNQVRVILLQDAAKGRFREEGMFEKLACDDDFSEWKPWIQYPQLEEIKIPFTYNPVDKRYSDILVEVNKALDITTHLQPGLVDSDDGPRHQLLQWREGNLSSVTQLPILVRVTEEAGFDNRHLAVQFTDLTCDTSGVVRGYVRLVAALGDQLNKHEGVMVLTLTFKQGENTLETHP